jgi:hypothetical protein
MDEPANRFFVRRYAPPSVGTLHDPPVRFTIRGYALPSVGTVFNHRTIIDKQLDRF